MTAMTGLCWAGLTVDDGDVFEIEEQYIPLCRVPEVLDPGQRKETLDTRH